jgi:hypothetical protein
MAKDWTFYQTSFGGTSAPLPLLINKITIMVLCFIYCGVGYEIPQETLN